MKHLAPQFDLPGTADTFNLAGESLAPAPPPAPAPDTTPDLFGQPLPAPAATYTPKAPYVDAWTRAAREQSRREQILDLAAKGQRPRHTHRCRHCGEGFHCYKTRCTLDQKIDRCMCCRRN